MADDKLKQAAMRALAWFEKANAGGDAGCDFLNEDDTWPAAEEIELELHAALRLGERRASETVSR
jgi:hypothetical protein